MKKFKACIIGLGRIASLLEDDKKREKPCTHAGAIADNPDLELSGGFDIDEDRRKLFKERWNVPVFSSAEEMIDSVKPDLAVLATHPDSHLEYCKLCASKNIPVVICEKPLADTISKAKKIVHLTEKTNTKIITNHERRYSADYIKAKEIIESGSLGDLLSIKASLFMGKTRRLLDVLWHDGTHLADIIMFLSGGDLHHKKRYGAKLKSNSGTAWLMGELRADNTLNPTSVILEIGAGRDHLVFETELSFSKGRLRIGNGIFEVWESKESPYAENFRSLELTEKKFESKTAYFSNMVQDAVCCINEKEKQPVSSAIDGFKVIKYLHSVGAWR